MMHARAVATPLISLNDYPAALRVIDAGITGIRRFLEDYEQSENADNCAELQQLIHWREELEAKRPADLTMPPQNPLEPLECRLGQSRAGRTVRRRGPAARPDPPPRRRPAGAGNARDALNGWITNYIGNTHSLTTMALHETDATADLAECRDRLLAELRSYESCAVAYSGGVDSAVVAMAAHLALGERAVAVTGVSASLAEGELDEASRVARQIGIIRHEVVETHEVADPNYLRNAPDRCLHCKTELYTELTTVAEQLGLAVLVNGANLDDLGDYRPGHGGRQELSGSEPAGGLRAE